MTAGTQSWSWDRWGWTGMALAAVGLADSVYLTWLKLADATAACAGIGDCDLVNNSRFASVGGIPIALLGALSYAAILGLLVADRVRPGWRMASRVAM
ncbi:MAG: vitamin K epoxide reductase family protein, partial [Anaerolineales bacterium]